MFKEVDGHGVPMRYKATVGKPWFASGHTEACIPLFVDEYVVPLWADADRAEHVSRRLERSPLRPEAIDLLGDEFLAVGISAITVSDYAQGVFYATVILLGGRRIDIRPTDAIILADALDIPFHIDGSVLNAHGFRVDGQQHFVQIMDGNEELRPEELRTNDVPMVDVTSDEEFSRLMSDLGVNEFDLSADVDADDDD